MRKIADADHVKQVHVADIDIDVAGDVDGEALDFDLAQHQIEDAASSLDAHRHTEGLDSNADAQSLVEGNPLQVDVNQLVLDGLALPVDDHGLGRGLAANLHVEDCVVSSLGKENPGNLLRVNLNGHGFVTGAIQNGRNLARDAHTASSIFGELAHAGLGYDNFRHSLSRF